jgi:predicted ATP-grasp superfamily ATP-dependent carboligase
MIYTNDEQMILLISIHTFIFAKIKEDFANTIMKVIRHTQVLGLWLSFHKYT